MQREYQYELVGEEAPDVDRYHDQLANKEIVITIYFRPGICPYNISLLASISRI